MKVGGLRAVKVVYAMLRDVFLCKKNNYNLPFLSGLILISLYYNIVLCDLKDNLPSLIVLCIIFWTVFKVFRTISIINSNIHSSIAPLVR